MPLSPKISRPLLMALGMISLALGVLGIFLPILPTTPLAILAAFLFSKSSPRLHQWALGLPKIGVLIQEWEAHKVIRLRAKIVSTLVIIPLFSYTFLFVKAPLPVRVLVLIIGICVLSFIWTRRSEPKEERID